jgi:hypothetical protein
MDTRAEKIESGESRQAPCEFCMEVSPLKDQDALYVLRAMRLNAFENALNAVEHFLGHLDLTEDQPTFNTASKWLDDVIGRFAEIDTDGDGHISQEEIVRWGASNEQKWVACHFDALTRAELLPGSTHYLSLKSLSDARNVFRGLAILQRHLAEISRVRSGQELLLTADDIERYLARHGAEMATGDYLALLQLANYLKGLHKRFTLPDITAETNDVNAISPEMLWPDNASRQTQTEAR